jgi:thioredoxin-related protein
MKLFILIFLFIFLTGENIWLTDMNKAKQEAATKNELILLNFSGSDWCGPCMRTKKEIFETDVFIKYSSENLILVNADFPRLKKNKLDDALTKSNEALADMYNKEGEFPLTLILNAKGKVLKSWVGFPNESASEFVEQIKTIAHGNK